MTSPRDSEPTSPESRAVFDGEDSGAQVADPGATRRGRKQRPLWLELIHMSALALGLSIVLKTLFIGAFWIPSESMTPGFQVSDRILVQKVSYWSGNPERGDIVVFKDPNHWLEGAAPVGADNAFTSVLTTIGLYPEGNHLVKRVVGVAGDVISCCDDQGRLLVNGVAINEPYLRDPGTCAGPMPSADCRWRSDPVPAGHLFVMGDNRANSADSSAHMCPPDATDCVPGREFVPVDLVVGKVFVLVWPFDHFHWVTHPDSFEEVPNPA